jgi:squalene synthase HpnC
MATPAAPALEAPSGKTSATENFPVASRLMPRAQRPHIMAFYGFARVADDIADAADLEPEDKLARLRRLAAALTDPAARGPGTEKADALARSLAETGITARHALDLVDAFSQDAVKTRYADWDELVSYCNRSAAPVGRYLLDLNREDPGLWPASDALCNALQVLNHLQDLKDDLAEVDRVYLPEPWFAEVGATVADLGAPAASAAVRTLIDRALDRVDVLLDTAAPLAPRLKATGLALETAAIQALARRLACLLRLRDPLAQRVKPGKPAMAATAIRGVLGALAHRAWRSR